LSLAQSPQTGRGQNTQVPQFWHFCIVNLPDLAASQNGWFTGVISGKGFFASALLSAIRISLIYATPDGTMKLGPIGKAPWKLRAANAGFAPCPTWIPAFAGMTAPCITCLSLKSIAYSKECTKSGSDDYASLPKIAAAVQPKFLP
jgi:hypothetical protein